MSLPCAPAVAVVKRSRHPRDEEVDADVQPLDPLRLAVPHPDIMPKGRARVGADRTTVRPMNMIRSTPLLALALVVASCSGGESSTTVEQTTTIATTPPAPTTTRVPAATTTTASGPDGTTISRATALAVNECLDLWGSAQLAGRNGRAFLDEMDELYDACDNANAELEVDTVGVPAGDNPVNVLAYVLSTITVVVSFARLELVSEGDCVGDSCILAVEDMTTWLNLDEMSGDGVPDAFLGDQSLRTATIEDIEGLVIERG